MCSVENTHSHTNPYTYVSKKKHLQARLHNSQHKLQAVVVVVDMSFINDGRVGDGAHFKNVLFNQAWIKFSQNSSSRRKWVSSSLVVPFNSHNSSHAST